MGNSLIKLLKWAMRIGKVEKNGEVTYLKTIDKALIQKKD